MAENEETSNDSSVRHFETITVKVEIVESDLAQEMDFQDSNTEADDPDKNIENASSAGQPQKPKKRMRKKMEAKLECDQCDYRTPYRRCLYYHKISHEQNPTPLACDLCTYRTKYPQSLERHTITKHHADEVEPTFRCTECPYKAIFKSDLKAHKRKHSTDKKYKCNLCDYSTVYHNLLKKHVRVHHCDKEVFKCDKCSFIAKAEGYLIRHMSKAHNELTENAIKCENCDFMTKVRWRLNIHKRKSYLGVPISCEHCSFSSMFKCEFKLHKKTHIKQIGHPSEILLNCPENDDSNPVSITVNDTNKKSAQKTFTQIDEEKLDEMEWGNIPVKEIPTDKLFQCTLCDYSSKYKASVQRHFQRRHMTNKKPYKCTNCNFSTNTKDQLSLHTKRSKCTKLQICNICNYNTFYKCQLVSHQKNHNPFKCEHCDYTCKTEYYLQQHFTNVHFKNYVELEVDEDGAVEGVDDDDDLDWDQNQGVRRGKRLRSKRKLMRSPGQQSLLCELCDYSTRHHASLQRHTISQHKVKEPSNLPTYDCTECPYKSIFKSNLAAHRRKHSMEKKFKCGLCEFSTAYKHNFLKHSKVHTNKEETAYKCDKCPFVTKYEGHITRHLAKIHNEVSEKASKCDNCSFTTKVKWRLNVHRNRSRQNSPIKCEHCDFSSLFTCEFKTHKAVHRGLAPKYRDTNAFNQTLNTVKPLDTCLHVESPSNTNQDIGLPFNITGDVTDQESIREFEPHLEYSKTNRYLIDTNCEINWKDIPVKELQGMQRMFKCTVCSYKSKFKASIQRHHYRRHTENKNRPYKCINCDFATKTKDKISLHVKRSQSTVPLKCNSCPFVTHFKCQQIQHQKMHNMFKCLFCQFTCKNNTELQRHNGNSHFGEGIKCKFCDYRAPRKESIICHEWIHTGIKPFRCDHCEYSCMRRRLLEAHVNKNHCVKKDEVVYISDSKIQKLRVDNKSEPVLENNVVWIATEDHGDSNSGS